MFQHQNVAVPGGRIDEPVYYVPGIIAYGVIAATFSNLVISVVRYRETGIYKRRRATPLPASAVIAARALVAAVSVLAITAVLLAIGWAAFAAHIPSRTGPAFLLDIIVGAIVFSCLGFAVASLISNIDAAQPVTLRVAGHIADRSSGCGECSIGGPGTGAGAGPPARPLAGGGGPDRPRQRLQCPVQGAGQRYLAVQSGQTEQLPGPGPVADYLQAGPVRGGTPGRADQRREPGGINEADLVKVDYQRAAAGCQLEKALTQPGYGGNVNFSGDSHDRIAPVAPNPDGQRLAHS